MAHISKINQLLAMTPEGVVLQSSWLKAKGYSFELQKKYRQSNWFTSIGSGAMVRTGSEPITIEGALYSLQSQSNLSIHIAGKTALGYLGKAHYMELSQKKVVLFGAGKEQLPKWFTENDWGLQVDYQTTGFLPPKAGLEDFDCKTYKIQISSALRAMLECIYLSKDEATLLECLELMEGLNNLIPKQVQELLEQCNSVKVNRLFLFMAEKLQHNWFKYLQTDRIYLGSGKRSLTKDGVFNEKYGITLPKTLLQYGS